LNIIPFQNFGTNVGVTVLLVFEQRNNDVNILLVVVVVCCIFCVNKIPLGNTYNCPPAASPPPLLITTLSIVGIVVPT
jgi:hypothetical protein